MDKSSEEVLGKIDTILATRNETSISSPEYNKEQIDSLINAGYFEKIDANTLSS